MKRFTALLLAVLMLFSLAACKKEEEKEPQKAEPTDIVAKSENFSFNLAEATYLFNKYYNEFTYQNADYLSFYGIDKETSLKEQTYTGDKTWFDYFAEMVTPYLKELLGFCEAAKAAGMELSDENKATIDKIISSFETQATENGYTPEEMISGLYGSQVNLSVLRSFIEKEQLAINYYNNLLTSYSFTEADEDAYLAENKDKLTGVCYISYTFNEKNDRAAKDHAAELLAATSADEFAQYITNYERTVLKYGDESLVGAAKTYYASKEDTAVSSWAYSAAAETSYLESNEVDGVFTVYMLTKTPSTQDYITRNVRYITLSSSAYGSNANALKKANEILDTWKNGAATAESFGELASKYSEDTSNKADGGVYTDVFLKDSTLPVKATEWLYDSATTIGSTAVIKGDSQYFVVYYESDGRAAWRVSAKNALRDVAYAQDTAKISEKYNVEIFSDVVNQIEG